jgi:glucose uptake protein GlcU
MSPDIRIVIWGFFGLAAALIGCALLDDHTGYAVGFLILSAALFVKAHFVKGRS